MKILNFKESWDLMTSNGRTLVLVVGCLAVANVSMAVKIANEHERDVLVPPQLTQRAEVGWNTASAEYYKPWGLFIGAMLGSITPHTAAYVAQALEPFFVPELWPKIAVQILSIADDPNYAKNGTINLFTPHDVMWEASTKKVFVPGILSTTAYRTSTTPVSEIAATYEMSFEMQSGVPKVTYFTSYMGEPRTIKWLSIHKGDPILKKTRSAPNSIIPQESEIRDEIAKAEADEQASEAQAAQAASADAAAKNSPASAAAPASNPEGHL